MKFCPKCEAKLRKGIDGLSCPKCGHAESSDAQQHHQKRPADSPAPASAAETRGQNDDAGGDVLNVFDDSGGAAAETRPTIKIECEKCGNDEAVWWMLQTRSADEPTTQFYRCTKCEYTWRDYS